ncbi:MAG: FliH/SctL family protein [Pseudomonadota bacterium]
MSFYVIKSTRSGVLSTDDLIIRASEYPDLKRAADALQTLEDYQDELAKRSDAQQQAAHKEGFHAGYAEGTLAAKAEYRSALLELLRQREALEKNTREAVRSLAFEIVRRIIDETSAAETVGKVADRILSEIEPNHDLKVLVAPSNADPIRERLKAHPNRIEVIEDPNMSDTDCLMITPDGEIDGSIETQLSSLESALLEAGS